MPIVQSTTGSIRTEKIASLFDMPTEYMYSRFANPTCDAVEKKIRRAGGRRGAMLTSSGQAASLLAILNLCSAGGQLHRGFHDLAGGTINLFGVTLKNSASVYLGGCGSDAKGISKLFKPNTKAVFGETLIIRR